MHEKLSTQVITETRVLFSWRVNSPLLIAQLRNRPDRLSAAGAKLGDSEIVSDQPLEPIK